MLNKSTTGTPEAALRSTIGEMLDFMGFFMNLMSPFTLILALVVLAYTSSPLAALLYSIGINVALALAVTAIIFLKQ